MANTQVQKSAILIFVNAKLKREDAVAGILDEINSVLKDLSRAAKWPNLYRSNITADQTSLTSGDNEISFPDNFRLLDKIVINDGTNDGRPLVKITFDQYQKRREDESSSNYDEPRYYARRKKLWYPDPIPDDDYTAKYWFWRYHPVTESDTEDILFDIEFDRVIKYGVCAEVAKSHKMTGYIAIWEPRYEFEKRKMLPDADKNIEKCQYSDF